MDAALKSALAKAAALRGGGGGGGGGTERREGGQGGGGGTERREGGQGGGGLERQGEGQGGGGGGGDPAALKAGLPEGSPYAGPLGAMSAASPAVSSPAPKSAAASLANAATARAASHAAGMTRTTTASPAVASLAVRPSPAPHAQPSPSPHPQPRPAPGPAPHLQPRPAAASSAAHVDLNRGGPSDVAAASTADEETLLPTPDVFPFPFAPYPIQVDFMRHLYAAIEARQVAVLESPTGTVRVRAHPFEDAGARAHLQRLRGTTGQVAQPCMRRPAMARRPPEARPACLGGCPGHGGRSVTACGRRSSEQPR